VPILVLGSHRPHGHGRGAALDRLIHTALVQGTQVRDYVKLDDQPASVGAIPEAFLRAWRLARTEPQGPVYRASTPRCRRRRSSARCPARRRALPARDAAARRPASHRRPRARRLAEARYPVISWRILGRRPAGAPLCRLAELLAAPLVDLAVEYQEGRACRAIIPST